MFNLEELGTVTGLATASAMLISFLRLKERFKKKWVIHLFNYFFCLMCSFIVMLISEQSKPLYIPFLMSALATFESVGIYSALKNTVNNETTTAFKYNNKVK